MLHSENTPLTDITTEQQAGATVRDPFFLVKRLKSEGSQVLLSLAAGRKIMAIYGLAVAQMLFERNDVLYYLFSTDSLAEERRLLLCLEDRPALVSNPFLRWCTEPVAVMDVPCYDDPLQALTMGSALSRNSEKERWVTFESPQRR